MEYEKVKKEVEKILSKERFEHSAGVARKAEKLANKYGENPEMAKLIGITHDIAKEFTDEEYLKYVKENNIEIDEIERNNLKLLHAKVGADICKKRFNFSEQMVNAIKYHTTGNVKMDNMAKIVYLADKTEDGRKYDGIEEGRKQVDLGLDEGMLYYLIRGIRKSLEKGKLIHGDSVDLYNKLLIEENI